jgi:hypothetical protein
MTGAGRATTAPSRRLWLASFVVLVVLLVLVMIVAPPPGARVLEVRSTGIGPLCSHWQNPSSGCRQP